MNTLSFAEITNFREAEFNGIQVWFTDLQIYRSTIPAGLLAYDIRNDDETGDFSTIEPFVLVNHGGTILSITPLLDEKQEYIDIADYGLDDETTPDAIIQELIHTLKR